MRLFSIAATTLSLALWTFRHRRSAAVTAWEKPQLEGQKRGELFARVGGEGQGAVVLLHGLLSTGDVYGADYDQLADHHRLIVPDLLGFGRSLNAARAAFSLESHLDALDELASETGLFDCEWTIGAHSMGSALAMQWAARHPDRVKRVVCWGAPIYPSPAAARAGISGSAMARLFALDTRAAEKACTISCNHRTAAGWLAALAEPGIPLPVARAASLHTWPAYRDAMTNLILETDWSRALRDLADNGTRTELVWGVHDRVGDRDYAATILRQGQTITLVDKADHHLPMTHPQSCRAHLALPD